jgi:hypothetical protein
MPADFDMAVWVAESRARQGLPSVIQDYETLEKIALLVAIPSTQPQGARGSVQNAFPDRELSRPPR